MFVFSPQVFADSEKIASSINRHSYQRFDTAKTWSEAKNACSSQGGYLATVTSEAELAWLKIKKLTSKAVFLGATDVESFGDTNIDTLGANWTWITGEPFVYSSWYSPSSKNGAIGQDYLYLAVGSYSTWVWKSTKATQTYPYLCEWDSTNTAASLTSTDSLSWEIPKQQGCSESRLKKSSDTLTSAACFNTGTTDATVKVMPAGTSNSSGQQFSTTVMQITVNPLSDVAKMGYFFKITFPSELKISPISISNKEEVPKDAGMPEVLADLGDEAVGAVFGNLKYLWKYLIKPESVGDSSFLNKITSDSVFAKQLYPYQTMQAYFQRIDENAPITITLSSAVPFATFKDILNANGMSFYLGSDVNREILVEKMVSAK